MKLERWVDKVGAMTGRDLEKLRTEYAGYEKTLLTHVQAKLGPMSKTSKLLSACTGVVSSVEAALRLMRSGDAVSVADFEADKPNQGIADPLARHLQQWEKLGGLPDYPQGPAPSINL